ncbi:MAG: hypothetical protein AAFV07_18570, partial [Bacteroidota bacterium]
MKSNEQQETSRNTSISAANTKADQGGVSRTPPPLDLGRSAVPVQRKPADDEETEASGGERDISARERVMPADLPVQRRVERENGRPVAREDPFEVPDNMDAFRDALVRFIHPLVDSRRQDILVDSTNLRVIWASMRRLAGQTINLRIEFQWGQFRIEEIRVIIPGEVITITPGAPPRRTETPMPQRIQGAEESMGDIQHEAGTPARNPIDRVIEGGSRALGLGATGVRIGAMAAGTEALELGASIAGAVIA